MNRTKRDYCSKGRHPRWRAWRAEYDMSTIAWRYTGCFCRVCGARIADRDVVGSGDPDRRAMGRMRVLRGGVDVSIQDFRAAKTRSMQYRNHLIELFRDAKYRRRLIRLWEPKNGQLLKPGF